MMLALVPGGADTQPGTAAGQDVQRRHRLGQDARVAIGDARHHRPQGHAFGDAGRVGQRRVAFQHLHRRAVGRAYLEEVVHDPQAVEARVVHGSCRRAEATAQLGCTARPGELGNL